MNGKRRAQTAHQAQRRQAEWARVGCVGRARQAVAQQGSQRRHGQRARPSQSRQRVRVFSYVHHFRGIWNKARMAGRETKATFHGNPPCFRETLCSWPPGAIPPERARRRGAGADGLTVIAATFGAERLDGIPRRGRPFQGPLVRAEETRRRLSTPEMPPLGRFLLRFRLGRLHHRTHLPASRIFLGVARLGGVWTRLTHPTNRPNVLYCRWRRLRPSPMADRTTLGSIRNAWQHQTKLNG